MGKVIIVLLLVFGGCAYFEHLKSERRVARETRTAAEQRAAAEAEAKASQLARRSAFAARRDVVLADVQKAVAAKEWRLANHELEPWERDGDPTDVEFNDLSKKIKIEFAALEKKLAVAAEAEDRKRRKREGVRVGMTADEVLMSQWGRPERVNRTVTKYGVREQWVYPGFQYLYFENDKLTSIQHSR